MNVEVFDPGRGKAAEGCASSGNMRGGSSSGWPAWRMSTLPGVGNDVVDLKEPENRGKSGDDRFLGRVFTAEERELIAGAAVARYAPLVALGGEGGGLQGRQRRRSVGLLDSPALPRSASTAGRQPGRSDAAGAEGCLAGRVITPRGEVALRITVTDDYVHALAAGSPCRSSPGSSSAWTGWMAREPPGMHRHSSAGNSFAEIARRLDCPIADLAVRKEPSGSGAPRVFLRGRPLAADISLSHDGRFAAFALAISLNPHPP